MPSGTRIILILEDNDDDYVFVVRAARKVAIEAVLRRAVDGKDAIRYLAGEGEYGDRATHPIPDLIISDVNMPGMNGFEFVRWVRADGRFAHIPLRMLSSSRADGDAKQASELRVEKHLKPLNPTEWLALVPQTMR